MTRLVDEDAVMASGISPIDFRGRDYLIVAAGESGDVDGIVDDQRALLQMRGLPVDVLRVSQGGAEQVGQRLDLLRAGSRVVAIGEVADVLQVLSAARLRGALPTELHAITLPTSRVIVFCAHCERTASYGSAPGEQINCAGCDLRLEIRAHTSIFRGAHLAGISE